MILATPITTVGGQIFGILGLVVTICSAFMCHFLYLRIAVLKKKRDWRGYLAERARPDFPLEYMMYSFPIPYIPETEEILTDEMRSVMSRRNVFVIMFWVAMLIFVPISIFLG